MYIISPLKCLRTYHIYLCKTQSPYKGYKTGLFLTLASTPPTLFLALMASVHQFLPYCGHIVDAFTWMACCLVFPRHKIFRKALRVPPKDTSSHYIPSPTGCLL